MKTIDFLKQHNACRECAKWALSVSDDMSDVWDALVEQKRLDWLLWTATRPGVGPTPTLRKLVCRFVRETPLRDGRTVWDLLADERSRKAVEVAEAFADGNATEAELAAARVAAYDAARAAAATRAAVDVAADAATEAAYNACYAAYYATRADFKAAASYAAGCTAAAAARAAARVAARGAAGAATDVACTAARAAARATAYAAGAAAEAAARAAARSAQIKMIADLGNPFRKEPPMSESHDNRTMQGKTGEEQAKRAIRHVLGVIRDHAEVGWYMGAGTQSFDLLTEAAATLFDEPLDKVRSYFLPLAPRDPKEDGCDKETSKYCPYCGEELENQ